MSHPDDAIEWHRGWVPPDGVLPLVNDAWLPEESVLARAASDIVTLDQVRDVSCLVLLGEPGSGKSFALLQEAHASRLAASPHDEIVSIDLGMVQDARELRERIVDDSAVARWSEGDGRLFLFLDALDEAKIQIRKVVSLLEQQLGGLNIDRMVLRITCRTADRPTEFESWLRRRFGQNRFETLELAPLRLSETQSAAEAAGLDADRFVESAMRAGAGPLAARPLTLNMLLRVFAAEGGFPDALAPLYQRALLLMAGEDDPERRDRRTLSDTASVAIAARIAAATVLAGRDVIGEGVARVVGLEEMAGGAELDRLVAQPTDVAVDETAVREVLGTALFSARTGGLGWAHRTFGEYLAAFWLAGPRVSDAQVADLLLVNDGTSGRIAPALRNVAGWLLTLRDSFQDSLVPADAVVLVYGDPSSVAPEIRRALLPALLGAIGDQEIERSEVRSLWRRLAYEGIANDLLPPLTDKRRHDHARQAAADAIAELQLAEMVPALVDIALDPHESIVLRTSALYALRPFGTDVPLDQIRPLAMDPQPSDIDDELKGAALRLCWPAAMTVDELFASLTPEKNEALLGAYTIFLRRECTPYLRSPRDLLAGVRWALTVPREWHATRDVTIVADIIVAKAWLLAAIHEPIAQALADLVVLAEERFLPLLASASSLREEEAPDTALHDGAANAAIIDALVGRVADGRFPLESLRRAVPRSLTYGVDITQIVERWSDAIADEEREAWRAVILALARGTGADALFDLQDVYPELYAEVAWRYEAVRLDSPEADAMRAQWESEQKALRLPAEARVDTSQFDQQVVAEMDAFRNGDADAYWRMQYALMVDDDGLVRDREHRDDLTETAGWRRATQRIRDDIADGATIYLRKMDPDPDQWLGKNIVYWPAWGGYCALKLLFKERREAFDGLEPSTWTRWAPIVVAWRRFDPDEDENEFRTVAMGLVRTTAPDVARSTVVRSLKSELGGGAIAAARDRLADLWDASMDDALFKQLSRSDLSTDQTLAVAESLVESRHAEALAWARGRVLVAAICDEGEREVALRMVAALARQEPATTWELIEEIATSSDEAGRLLLARLGDRFESGWTRALEPDQLGRLFDILHRFFPPVPEAPAQRGGPMTPETQASLWRGQILEQLVLAGTPDAVAVVLRLEQAFDEYGWLRRMRHRAQEQLRRVAWKPPEPSQVVRMGSVDPGRYVPDSVALRGVVLDALTTIARDMRGAFPLAPTLWNTAPHRLPKSENEITNELARWMRDRIGRRRAIVNREVEINAFTGGGGDRTDLLVQATSPDDGPLTVVIEVKGAWNPKLMTAMSDQLAAQYLKPDLTDQGVYLVFWFGAEGWEHYDNANEKRRRARGTRRGPSDLSAMLTRQAAEVSRDKGIAIQAVVIDGSLSP